MSKTTRRALLVLVILSIPLCILTILRASASETTESTYAPASVAAFATSSPANLPVHISIPSLGIEANVQHVGLTAKGSMGVPSNFTDTAWYKYGPVPGMLGSAVIDGHVDNGLSLPGVFKNLSQITPGTDIYIDTAAGKHLHFIVEEAQTYPYQDVPAEKLFTRKDKARLNLITCSGTWIPGSKTYDQRFVVYAVLAP